jgi:SAM-dependent methyltransferase
MPFEKDSFNFILCSAAFKNFADPLGTLQEMYRVLKPSGQGLIIDLRKDAPASGIAQAVDEMGLNGHTADIREDRSGSKFGSRKSPNGSALAIGNRSWPGSFFQLPSAGTPQTFSRLPDDLISPRYPVLDRSACEGFHLLG